MRHFAFLERGQTISLRTLTTTAALYIAQTTGEDNVKFAAGILLMSKRWHEKICCLVLMYLHMLFCYEFPSIH